MSTPTTLNQRVYWPVQAVGIGPHDASNTFNTVRGVQAFGLSARLQVMFLKEMGNLPTYASFEELPEVEVTLERYLDGYCPAYLLATQGAATADIAGRSTQRCHFAASVHRDNQSRASTNQIAQLFCSGAYSSSVSYTFPTQGEAKESLGLVGNDAVWTTGSYVFTGHTSGMGVSSTAPAFANGVVRRQHFDMAESLFPTEIAGIATDGTNPEVVVQGNTQFSTSFETVSVSANFGRTLAYELGRKREFFRFVSFPVKVTSNFTLRSKGNPLFSLLREGANGGDNGTNQTILFKTTEGLVADLGSKNRLTSINRSGGDAGSQSDVMLTYTYENEDDLVVQHSADVTVGLRP
jgi:hypothetical protein